MKKCSTCKIEKPLEDFAKNPQKKDGLNYKCKECQKEYFKKHYAKNKKYYVDKAQEKKARDKIEVDRIIAEAKKCGCSMCGETHPATLDFHHVHGKDFTISRRGSKCPDTVMTEIKKCVVVCSNCHRKIHWNNT